jgi:hypothetical protein
MGFCQYDDFLTFLKFNSQSVSTVVFHQSGSYLIANQQDNIYNDVPHGDPIAFSVSRKNVAKVQQFLVKLSMHANVIWLGPYIEGRLDYTKLERFDLGFQISDDVFSLYKRTYKDLHVLQLKNKLPYDYIPFDEVYDISPSFPYVEGCLTFRDRDHFSICGEDILAGAFINSRLGQRLSEK